MEEEFRRKIGKLTADHNRKVAEDDKKYLELVEEKTQLKTTFLQEISEKAHQNEESLIQMKINQNLQLQQMKEEYNELKEMRDEMILQSRKTRANQEDNTWKQIDTMTDCNKLVLASDIEKGMDAKAKLTVALNQLKDKNTEKDKELRSLEEKKAAFEDNKQQSIKLNANIEQQKIELLERQATLDTAKSKILKLKKNIQELEKFKFVLHFKINELKHDIGPREIEIKRLCKQCNTFHSELNHYNRVKEKLDLICDHLRMRHEGLNSEIKTMSQQLVKQEEVKKMVTDDMLTVQKSVGDYKTLKKAVVRLHKIWVLEETKQNNGSLDVM